jgi:hypothetical protein
MWRALEWRKAEAVSWTARFAVLALPAVVLPTTNGAGWGAARAAEIPGDAENKALHDLLQRDGLCRPTSISLVNSVV